MAEKQKITFSISGEKQYSRAFEALAHEVEDLSEPLRQVGDSLISDVHSQFSSEGSHGRHGQWKPLNPTYERWKRQQVGDQPILVFTGRTRSAMISRGAINVSPRRLVYQPSVPDYAVKHQVGDGVPQRRMVDLPDATKRSWDRFFHVWLNAQRNGPIVMGRGLI